MKKIDIRDLLNSSFDSSEFSSFVADCLDGVVCGKHFARSPLNPDDKTNSSTPKCVYRRFFDKFYQTMEEDKECALFCEFYGKNDVIILIRQGTKFIEEGSSKLVYHHGRHEYAPNLFGQKMYIIHMVPTETGSRVDFSYYSDMSKLFDIYFSENKLNPWCRTERESADVALFKFGLLFESDRVFEELTKYRIWPDEVRIDEVDAEKATKLIHGILVDPWVVIRRFEQIEESKLRNSGNSINDSLYSDFGDSDEARKL